MLWLWCMCAGGITQVSSFAYPHMDDQRHGLCVICVLVPHRTQPAMPVTETAQPVPWLSAAVARNWGSWSEAQAHNYVDGKPTLTSRIFSTLVGAADARLQQPPPEFIAKLRANTWKSNNEPPPHAEPSTPHGILGVPWIRGRDFLGEDAELTASIWQPTIEGRAEAAVLYAC